MKLTTCDIAERFQGFDRDPAFHADAWWVSCDRVDALVDALTSAQTSLCAVAMHSVQAAMREDAAREVTRIQTALRGLAGL